MHGFRATGPKQLIHEGFKFHYPRGHSEVETDSATRRQVADERRPLLRAVTTLRAELLAVAAHADFARHNPTAPHRVRAMPSWDAPSRSSGAPLRWRQRQCLLPGGNDPDGDQHLSGPTNRNGRWQLAAWLCRICLGAHRGGERRLCWRIRTRVTSAAAVPLRLR